jgi:MraZ protein
MSTKTGPMFIGEYAHTLDIKGRLALPVRFRKDLGEKIVVTRGFDTCLFIYPESEWATMAAKLAALPLAQANTRAFARFMSAGAMEVEIDKQGRAMIPEYLRKYAGLSKKIVVTGLMNRLEVWDSSAWQKYREDTERNSGSIAEALQNIGV